MKIGVKDIFNVVATSEDYNTLNIDVILAPFDNEWDFLCMINIGIANYEYTLTVNVGHHGPHYLWMLQIILSLCNNRLMPILHTILI